MTNINDVLDYVRSLTEKQLEEIKNVKYIRTTPGHYVKNSAMIFNASATVDGIINSIKESLSYNVPSFLVYYCFIDNDGPCIRILGVDANEVQHLL